MLLYGFAKVVVGAVYRVLFRFRVTGVENIPAEGGVILCANHISNQDVVALAIASPRKLHFFAKHELWRIKPISGLFDILGAIPVNRDNPGIDSLKRSVEVLQKGRPLVIFLQGTRKKNIDHADAKAGVALFAIKGKAPVVPIYIHSNYKFFSKIHINIGAPMSFEEYWGKKLRTEQLNAIAAEILDAIMDLGNIL